VVTDQPAKPVDFAPEAHVLDGVAELQEEFVVIERFREKSISAKLNGLDRSPDGPVRGEHDDRQVERTCGDLSEEVHATFSVESKVDENCVYGFAFENLDTASTRVLCRDAIAVVFESKSQKLTKVFIVVNDDDMRLRGEGALRLRHIKQPDAL